MGLIRISIIEEISSNKFIVKCSRCEGTGRGYEAYGRRSTEPCKVCSGKGLLLIEINGNVPLVECARCEGTGRGYQAYGKRSTEPCKACQGTGAQPISGSLKIIE